MFRYLTLSCLLATAAFAGTPDKNPIPAAPADEWEFKLAIPGWLPALEGDTGIGHHVSQVNMDPGDVFRHYDIAISLRGEVAKGRVGLMADLLYTSLSDGIGTETIVKKLDIQVDQTIADFALRWRVVEGPKGWVDIIGGVRYVNLFQQVVTQPNDEKIHEAVDAIGTEFGNRVQERIDDVLSEAKLRTALSNVVSQKVTNAAATFTGPNPPEQSLPNGPLAGPNYGRLGRIIDRRLREKARELIATTAANARATAQAEVAAVRATTRAARAEAQARVARLRAELKQRIATARAEVQSDIESRLREGLDTRVARTDDWWDPFIGLRARYNFNDRFYLIGRGDVGGFGVGSDFAWQAEGALGYQLTKYVFVEAGYRALGIDYNDNGLVYDVIMHGAQVTMGIQF